MRKDTFCVGCRVQRRVLVPIRGPLSLPFRLAGIRTSRMNPNLCNICENRFAQIMKMKQIVQPATVLFADVRDYTPLSELIGPQEVANLLTEFYDRCAQAIWERDGIINKLMGDAILAVFNFPIPNKGHVELGVGAALELQRSCQEVKSQIKLPAAAANFGVGIAVHTGQVSIGELGQYCKDFTVIGEVVNLTSRLQGVAKPGEVVLSEAVYERVKGMLPGITAQTYQLKGIEQPVRAYVLVAS